MTPPITCCPDLPLPSMLSAGKVPAMDKYCSIHPEVKLRVIVYCPACRGQVGGTRAAKSMTAEAKTKRAKKAARARWKKTKK
jgi:hypothetical protein